MNFRFIFLFLSGLLLSGCFAESMTLVQSGMGAYQGRALQSAISPAVSLGVKQHTGKYPLEHVILREKQRLEKKTTQIEKKIILKSKSKILKTKEKIEPFKRNIDNKLAKINGNFLKAKNFAAENFQHKPRFSFKTK